MIIMIRFLRLVISRVLSNSKILAVSILLAFSLTATLAIAVVDIDHEGSMSSCVLMGQEQKQSCQMTITQHIASWQQIFTATFNWSLVPLLLLAAAFVAGLTTIFKNIESMFLQLRRRYKKQNPSLKLFDYLLSAFSQGILHPKLYA